MEKEQYIGMMSGTSLDGIDVVLCEIDEDSCTLLHALEYPMPIDLKEDVLTMISSFTLALKEIGEINYRLGMLFADAVGALLKNIHINRKRIKGIGLHGQTLWHNPEGKYPFSMQLGDANILTARYGIPVITDFRSKDIALGGQGAPFAPAFHAFMFGDLEETAVVNIGGMANITILDEVLLGYDIGCGNVLLDLWINRHKNKTYDKEGTWAKSGKVDEGLLALMLKDTYFSQKYPKSTGREKFNMLWIDEVLSQYSTGVSPHDVQRCLLELVAVSISVEVLKFGRKKVLLCGGGAKNTFLYERIKILLGDIKIDVTDYTDEMEAMTFAWLAHERIHEKKVKLKEVTGAFRDSILGAVYL